MTDLAQRSNLMMRLFTLCLAGVTAALIACGEKSGAAPQPAAAAPAVVAEQPASPAEPEAAGRDSGKQYEVVATPIELKVGETGKAVFRIRAGMDLHFNEEFPAKFIFSAAAHARPTKDTFSKQDGDVKVENGVGVVSVSLTGRQAGTGPLSIIGHFSVCSDEQCFILRGEKLALNVTVK